MGTEALQAPRLCASNSSSNETVTRVLSQSRTIPFSRYFNPKKGQCSCEACSICDSPPYPQRPQVIERITLSTSNYPHYPQSPKGVIEASFHRDETRFHPTLAFQPVPDIEIFFRAIPCHRPTQFPPADNYYRFLRITVENPSI